MVLANCIAKVRRLATVAALLSLFPTLALAQASEAAPTAFGPSESEIRKEVSRRFAKGDFRVSADCLPPTATAKNAVCTYRVANVMITIASRLPNGKPHEASVWCPTPRQGPDALVAAANCIAAISVTADAAKTGWTDAELKKLRSAALEVLDTVSDVRFKHHRRQLIAQNVGPALAFHFSMLSE